jgi:hypothetical protein
VSDAPAIEPAEPKRRRRGRHARPSRSRAREVRALEAAKRKALAEARRAALEAKREAAKAAMEAAAAAKVEERKRQLAELAEVQRDLLRRGRPATVDEYCRSRGIDPDSVTYHPLYSIPGVPPSFPRAHVENICFAKNWPPEYGGLGAFRHLENYIRLTYPSVAWNDWLTRMLRSLTDDDYEIVLGETRMRFVSWVGCGAAGKTFAAGMFASCWFKRDVLFDRPQSCVTLTSTSKGIIAQRVWPVIQQCYHEARNEDGSKFRWGHLVDSKKMVQASKGDEKHSICAMAVEPGDLQASLDKIKGRHTERMLLIIDEANSTPQAIFECIPNMLTGVRELIVLVIGNAGSRLDPHGRCCEPKRGWKSITIEDDQWETKGVEQWGIGPGVCLHFDGARSPNVLAGRTEHRFIYSFERWQQVLRMGGEYRNTLQHWSQDRGFWPPDGLQTTVFTEALVVSHDGMGQCAWIEPPRACASLDTAFGADNCVYTPGLLGWTRGPKMSLQAGAPTLVPFDPESTESIDFQIARWFIARCQRDGVAPELAGLDATGIGRGVYAIVQQLWSPRVRAVEFGGAASDLPASATDARPSRDIYANRVTELWYICRELLVAGQLKGISQEAVKEFCTRLYEFAARRYKIEPKGDMKQRLGYSPDYADGLVVLVDVARWNGLKLAAVEGAQRGASLEAAWDEAEQDVAALAASSYTAAADYSPYADCN